MSLKYTLLFTHPLRFCIFFVFASVSANAQLTNAGGTITISNGASIVCQGNVTNTSGTITNDGKLEVRGSFINSGSGQYNSTANEDSLLLTDTGSVVLNTGNAVLNYLSVNKTNGGKVTLGSNATITNKLDMLGGSISTDPLSAFELIAPSTATFSFAAGTEILGKVRRTGWANETPLMFNHPNMIVTTHGGTAPTGMMVNMVPNGDPTAAEREVKRYFYFSPTAGSDYTADVTFPYTTSELDGKNIENNLVPWYYTAGEWNANFTGNTRDVAAHNLTATGIPVGRFAGTEWKLADPRYTFNVTALLRGPWNAGTQTLSTALNSILPLSQPYNTTPFNYTGTETVGAIPNTNIVDWVLLELRKPTSGVGADATTSTIIGRKAAFLTNMGNIVDLDGVTPASFDISKQGTSFVVVRHRNHLAVISNGIPSNAIGTFANDFSVLANSYKNPTSPSEAEALLSGGTKYGLWSGDVNRNSAVSITDVNAIKLAIASSAGGYLPSDVNLSANVSVADVNLAKATIAASGSGSASARTSNSSNTSEKATVISSVPE